MHPKLKLDNIHDLHDARYCAAVGISLLGFDLDPGTSKLQALQVGEIMEWLSGPTGIAAFGDLPPTEINAASIQSKCTFVSLPIDYPTDWAFDIELPVLFRYDGNTKDRALLLQKMVQFPQAIIEMDAALMLTKDSAPSLRHLAARAVLVCPTAEILAEILADPEIQPWGFALGGFVLDSKGGIDYDRCDAFLDAYSG